MYDVQVIFLIRLFALMNPEEGRGSPRDWKSHRGFDCRKRGGTNKKQ
jgi:hypothetical protein